MHRRDFLKYSLAAGSCLLMPKPLLAAASCPATALPLPHRQRFTPKQLQNLTISLHPRSHMQHHRKFLDYMDQGFKKHGLSPIYAPANRPIDTDIAITWSAFQQKMIRYRRQRGLNTLIMERGFFQPRFSWTSLGWEDINGCAQFVTVDDGGARWNAHFADYLKPWKTDRSGYILLLGQKPGDRALYGLRLHEWLKNTAQALRIHEKPILFRPHPLMRKHYTREENPLATPSGATLSSNTELAADLAGAAFSVTYSSTSAVESILAGVPCVTHHHGSIAHAVTSHSIEQPYFTPDRTSWCHQTAWKQWSEKEIASGDAWDIIKRYLLA